VGAQESGAAARLDARLTLARRLSIVIPTLNEAAGLPATLAALAPLRARGHEVVVADGGSEDGTVELARGLCDLVIRAATGRAAQMNAGARAAHGDALVFLHADTSLPKLADEAIFRALEFSSWGRFDIRIAGRHPLLKCVAGAMNLRSRLTGIATGDQAIFVRRDSFSGFPEIALMEDIAFSKSMNRRAPPACLRERVITSGRRWEKHGVLRTIFLMWGLRAAFALGADPAWLARRYR
jgi:rSAM/selenodomain-associated transferase 2